MMYNQKPKGARRLRPFALVPALALALAVTALPAVAEMLTEIRSTDLTSPEITEKSEPVQTESPVGSGQPHQNQRRKVPDSSCRHDGCKSEHPNLHP